MFIAVVDEQNQQTAIFSEDRQTLAGNIPVISTEATLHDIDEYEYDVEHCSPRLSEPVRVSENVDTPDMDKRNMRSHSQLHALRNTNCSQTSDPAATLSLPQPHG